VRVVVFKDGLPHPLTRAKDVQQRTSFSAIDALPLELGAFASVVQFVNQFEEEGFQLNAVVANAGTQYTKTLDGWETTYREYFHFIPRLSNDALYRLQVNYLSTALLSILMIPHLIASSTP
jgi:retinol dehydrogenase-12